MHRLYLLFYDLDAFIQYGFLRIRFFSGILCHDLIAGALIYTLIRLCYVYPEKRWKALLIFLSYILCPLSVGVLGSYVVNVVQIHLLTFLVMILMILVSYLPPLYLHYTKRNQ